MKRIALPVIVLNVMLFVAACGGATPAATQAPEAQPPPAQPAAEQSSANPPATETPVAAVGTEVNITLPISVAGSLDAALQTALLAVPKNQLGGGAQVIVQYTFPDTAASTQLEFSCLIPRHYEDGMKLPITVTN